MILQNIRCSSLHDCFSRRCPFPDCTSPALPRKQEGLDVGNNNEKKIDLKSTPLARCGGAEVPWWSQMEQWRCLVAGVSEGCKNERYKVENEEDVCCVRCSKWSLSTILDLLGCLLPIRWSTVYQLGVEHIFTILLLYWFVVDNLRGSFSYSVFLIGIPLSRN